MMNLRLFFTPNPYLLSVTKTEKELLESFLIHKPEYENWLLLHPQPKINFRFYFPSAIDFYYSDARLFTVYFKTTRYEPELSEIKMSRENYASIRSTNWKPFADVMLKFLQTLHAKNEIIYRQQTKSLHDYLSVCKEPASFS